MWEAFALLLLAAGTFLWIDTLRAREAALAAGRAGCERYGLLLLDDTVAVMKMRLARDAGGRLRVARTYAFELVESDTSVLALNLDDRASAEATAFTGEPRYRCQT